MAMTSPEPSLPSSSPLSSDGAAVGFAVALGMTACNGDRLAIGFATELGTTAWAGVGAISVAAASKTIAHDGKEYSNTLFTMDS